MDIESRPYWFRRLLTILLLLGSALAQEADETPSFPTETAAITVDVVVVDEEGQPVPGLTREDFTVREDGRAQAVVAFEARNLSERNVLTVFGCYLVTAHSGKYTVIVSTSIYYIITTGGWISISGFQLGGNAEPDIGAHHENVTMGKVKQHENAVDHGVPHCDEGVKASPLQGIDQVLHEKVEGHGHLLP